MTRPVTAAVTTAFTEPFTKRARNEFAYAVVSVPLSAASFAFTLVMLHNGFFWALSAGPLRKLADLFRCLAAKLLGEDVPAPPPLRTRPFLHVKTPDAERFSPIVEKDGGPVRQWMFNYGAGICVRLLPAERVRELAAANDVRITELRPMSSFSAWFATRNYDKLTWRIRLYIAVKPLLAAIGLTVAAGCYLYGLYFLLYPVFGPLGYTTSPTTLAGSFLYVPIGAAMFLAAPWLMRGTTEPDRWLIRTLLGPTTTAERIRDLEETRTIAVEDSAAKLRTIERDLHDGTQAQLVAIAMKLGLAKEKLTARAPGDLARVTQLVHDAQQTALDAIVDLRTLARGIHPPVLDKGLADALATLASRSAVPVDLVTDIAERPSDAIETIAYFSAAELLANVAKHSQARHATLEAVHVPGLLRIRVTDDGHGGATPVTGGGLRGLAERVRTVDGHLDIDSPSGGPTVITVELPSRA
jgi:signal transduction histidine kinase